MGDKPGMFKQVLERSSLRTSQSVRGDRVHGGIFSLANRGMHPLTHKIREYSNTGLGWPVCTLVLHSHHTWEDNLVPFSAVQVGTHILSDAVMSFHRFVLTR